MLRLIIIGGCFIIAGLFLQSKDLPERSSTFTVYINFEDYSVRANVLYDADKVKTKMGHMYYWYVNNDIKKTDGSFDGKLLHGEYKSFFRNLNLREQGSFVYGLKDGTWKSWYLNGNIHEIINYKNGIENGALEIYDEQGIIVSKTNFKNGKKNGKMISYEKGKIDTIISYKHDQPDSPKPKKSHLNSKNKKQKDTTKSETKKVIEAKDTIAKTPKSSFNIKKIFNKEKKIDEKNKRGTKKEIQPKKKSKSSTAVSAKKS